MSTKFYEIAKTPVSDMPECNHDNDLLQCAIALFPESEQECSADCPATISQIAFIAICR